MPRPRGDHAVDLFESLYQMLETGQMLHEIKRLNTDEVIQAGRRTIPSQLAMMQQ